MDSSSAAELVRVVGPVGALLLVVWAELRLLPPLRAHGTTILAWSRAIGAHLAITAEALREAARDPHPIESQAFPRARASGSGIGPAAAILVALVFTAGCVAAELGRVLPTLRADLDTFAELSQPAADVTTATWAAARDAIRETARKAEEHSR